MHNRNTENFPMSSNMTSQEKYRTSTQWNNNEPSYIMIMKNIYAVLSSATQNYIEAV